jgi:hypothetical protein
MAAIFSNIFKVHFLRCSNSPNSAAIRISSAGSPGYVNGSRHSVMPLAPII